MKIPSTLPAFFSQSLKKAIGDDALRDLVKFVGDLYQQIQAQVNGNLQITENVGITVDDLYVAAPGDLQTLGHALGRVPVFYDYMNMTVASPRIAVWSTPADVGGWTDSLISYRCSDTGTALRFWLI